MQLRQVLCSYAIFILCCGGAIAQEDPEAVYAKLHSAALAGNVSQVMAHMTGATLAELTEKSPAEREALIRSLARVAPKTYTITQKAIAPDGNSAVLRGTGVREVQGRPETYLSASFRKEGDAWKATILSWSDQKPPPIPAPAAPAASSVVASDEAPPAKGQVVRRLGVVPGVIKGDAAVAKSVVAPVSAKTPRKPSRAHLDARACLKLPTDKAIMTCAEKYR